MKRALDIVEEEDGYIFKYRDGSPIPPEVLVSRFKHQLMTLLSFRMSMSFLANMERSGNVLRNFVRSNNLWCILFQRDYPDQFEGAHEPGSYQMRAETRAWLDGMSDNPERPETYWKRFYEYMTKLTRMLKAEEDNVDERLSLGVFGMSIVDMFAFAEYTPLSWMLGNRRYPYLDWINPQRRKLVERPLISIKKDAGGDVLYFYMTGFVSILDNDTKGIINHPTKAIRVTLKVEIAANIVDWDDHILTLETVPYPGGRCKIWPSRDARSVYMLDVSNSIIFRKRDAPVDNLRLVSSCVTCDTPRIAGKCDQCDRQYCSQDCLDADCHH